MHKNVTQQTQPAQADGTILAENAPLDTCQPSTVSPQHTSSVALSNPADATHTSDDTSTSPLDFMATERLSTLLPRLAAPLIVAQLLALLYNIADRAFIGHIDAIGTDALAGVGICFPLIGLIVAFANWIGMGSTPHASMDLGSGNIDGAQKRFLRSCWILAAMAVSLLFVSYTCREPLLVAFGCSSATLPFADTYFSIYAISIPFTLVSIGLSPFLNAQGESKISLLSLGTGNVLNVILDWLFIFPLGWGVAGAAWASVIGQGVSAAITLIAFTRTKSTFRLAVPLRPSLKDAGQILLLGSGPFFMQSTEQFMIIIVNYILITTGGDIYVAANTAYLSIMVFAAAPITGFISGTQPVLSYCYGAKNYTRTRHILKVSFIVCIIINFVIVLPAMLLPEIYVGIFTTDTALIALGARNLPIFFAGYLFFGILVYAQAAFVSMGFGVFPLIVAGVRKLVLLIPLAAILSFFFVGPTGCFWAEGISDLTSVVLVSFLFYFKVYRHIPKD